MWDDFGTQNGMLMSPELWRQIFKPRQEKFIRAVKETCPGIKIFYHCCGSIVPIIGDLIEIGVDVLNPIQVRAKDMNPLTLKKRFGRNLSFHGVIDVQELLPNANVDDLVKEINELVAVLGKDGGYILAPTHNIQVDTPPENVLAMYDSVGRQRVGQGRRAGL
jgi:uroporphyrinogen decarboxylase